MKQCKCDLMASSCDEIKLFKLKMSFQVSKRTVILLLPLYPVSLVHKNPQTQSNLCHVSRRMQRLIDLKIFFAEYPVCVIFVVVLVAVVK